MSATKNKGRKPGPAHPQPTVEGGKTHCPVCDSTEREAYYGTNEHAVDGVREGAVYTHVVWRRTRCRNCGQFRIDKAFENRA